MNEPFEPFLELYEGAEVGNARNDSLDYHARLVPLLYALPRVLLKELGGERETLVVAIDVEHHGFYLIALPENLGRVFDLLPREVGDMYEPVDAVLNADEYAEIRAVLSD